MDYLWEIVSQSKFNSDIRTEDTSFFDLIKHDYTTEDLPGDIYRQNKISTAIICEINEILESIDYMNKNEFELKKRNFNHVIKKGFKKLKNKINTPIKAKLLIKTLEELNDGYSKLFLLLYIVSNFSKKIGYSLKDLFSKDAKPLPTLRKTKPNEKPQYTLFEKYNYNRK